MTFNTKHNSDLYNTLLSLSRNLFFYDKIKLPDTFETRIYLMFMHFSVMLIIFKQQKMEFPQKIYDDLFNSVEYNLRELGFGDVAVNTKMKNMNKTFYDILLKVNISNKSFKINKNLILKYFESLNDLNNDKYELFEQYMINFYHFCFDIKPQTMIKDALKFKVI